jgi:hypothetical protein
MPSSPGTPGAAQPYPGQTPAGQPYGAQAVPGQAVPGQAIPGQSGAVPPGGVPPTGQPPASGGNNKLPWIIAAAVAVVAVVVVAVVLLTGDDNTTSSPGTTTIAVPSTTIAGSTTLAPTTTAAPQTTLAITSPPTTTPPPTTATPGVNVFTDDTNTFTVLMLDTFEVDTTPIDQDGVTLGNVTGATDLKSFASDTDHDTFGISVSVGPTAQLPSVDELLASADPGPTVCTDRTNETDYPTQVGPAQALLLDGCGTGGASSKVVMVIPFNGTQYSLLVYAQGPGPSNTDLFDFAQAVAESVVIL